MSNAELTFAFIVIFLAIYGSFTYIAYVIDRFLWKRFNKGLFPREYFK